ncbi:MAG: metalloregulator ArsR/SmtB family transcription factor [Candidatus Nanohaloarchaea archaeon]
MKTRIEKAVEDSPGIHFRGLKREVGCSVSTLEHHLRNDSNIKDTKIRSYRRVYPASVPERYYSALAAMNHERRGKILWMVENGEEVAFGDIAERMDSSRSTVSHHLKILADDNLVEEESRGRTKIFSTSGRVHTAFRKYTTNMVKEMSGNFTEMWSQ